MKCGLCLEENSLSFKKDIKRNWQYWHCQVCDLVFRDPETYLDKFEEKARYETHNNSIESPGYVKFLTPAVEILKPYLSESSEGLDFGCGPGPIIDILFSRQESRSATLFRYIFSNNDMLTVLFMNFQHKTTMTKP